MSSERPKKKARISKDEAVSAGGSSSGGIHLTPELVARVATFADAVGSPDVMNICLAVGPDTSRTVRYYYLWRNQKFLYDSIRGFARRDISRDKACSNLLAWMKVNTSWRRIAVRDALMDKFKLACEEQGSGQNPVNISHPLIAFNNPAVAIQIGLFDSLKHLVEVKGIDINSFEWSAYGSTNRMHLLCYAAKHSRKELFEYLLNRPGFNIRCRAKDTDTREGGSLFNSLLLLLNQEGRFESSFLKLFMKHPEFRINGQIVPSLLGDTYPLVSPLYSATVTCVRALTDDLYDEEGFQAVHEGTQILLSAGADPNLIFPDRESPISFFRSIKTLARAGNFPSFSVEGYKASEKYWDDALALLEKYA